MDPLMEDNNSFELRFWRVGSDVFR